MYHGIQFCLNKIVTDGHQLHKNDNSEQKTQIDAHRFMLIDTGINLTNNVRSQDIANGVHKHQQKIAQHEPFVLTNEA